MTLLIRKLSSHIKAAILSIHRMFSGSSPSQPIPASVVIPVQAHQIDPARVSRHAAQVTETLTRAGYRAFIVGGAVRDLLLGLTPKDFDVATDATPAQVRKLFRRARLIGREIIEVTTFRGSSGAPARMSQEGKRAWRRGRDSAHPLHAVDASGRVVRDKVWGEQHEDAARRDFTVNAMYYNPAAQTVLDYHNGIADVRARRLRMIGDPAARYREDPVRMLRVVRFAAKLGFEIDERTRAPIRTMAALLNSVPPARLFDEALKLLLCGHAFEGVQRLHAEGLRRCVLPLLDAALENAQAAELIQRALRNADARVRADQPVSPGFLFAALLWHEVCIHWQRGQAAGEYPIPALYRAMDETLQLQMKSLAIQRRTSADMKEIWGLQPRLEKRGRGAFKLIEHARFRAAYAFLQLRCASGELDGALGAWWAALAQGNPAQREALLAQCAPSQKAQKKGGRRKKGKAAPTDSTESAPMDGTGEER